MRLVVNEQVGQKITDGHVGRGGLGSGLVAFDELGVRERFLYGLRGELGGHGESVSKKCTHSSPEWCTVPVLRV